MSNRRRTKDSVLEGDNEIGDDVASVEAAEHETKNAKVKPGKIVYSTNRGNEIDMGKIKSKQKKDNDPTSVPKGSFFLHDDRDGGVKKGGAKNNFSRKSRRSQASNDLEWKHDKYEEIVAKESTPRKPPQPVIRAQPRVNPEPHDHKPTQISHEEKPVATNLRPQVPEMITSREIINAQRHLNPSAREFQPKLSSSMEDHANLNNSGANPVVPERIIYQTKPHIPHPVDYGYYPSYQMPMNYMDYQPVHRNIGMSSDSYPVYDAAPFPPPLYDANLFYVESHSESANVWYGPEVADPSLFYPTPAPATTEDNFSESK